MVRLLRLRSPVGSALSPHRGQAWRGLNLERRLPRSTDPLASHLRQGGGATKVKAADRAGRRDVFPGAAAAEPVVDINEGIATYTQYVTGPNSAEEAIRHATATLLPPSNATPDPDFT